MEVLQSVVNREEIKGASREAMATAGTSLDEVFIAERLFASASASFGIVSAGGGGLLFCESVVVFHVGSVDESGEARTDRPSSSGSISFWEVDTSLMWFSSSFLEMG